MAKVIEARVFEKYRRLKALRAEIKCRQAHNRDRLEELQSNFSEVLAGVALQEIDPNEAATARTEIRRLLDELAAMEIIMSGLGAWNGRPNQNNQAAQTTNKGDLTMKAVAVKIPKELLRKSSEIAKALDKVAASEAGYSAAKLAVQRVRSEKNRLREVHKEISSRAGNLVQSYASGDLDEEDYRQQLVALGAEAAAADAVLQQMPTLEDWAERRMAAASRANVDRPTILGRVGSLESYAGKIRAGDSPDFHRERFRELAGILGLNADELLAAAGIEK